MTAGHVLVARLDSAGDVLLAGPAVRAVAARASQVTFLGGPSGAEAARLLPGVDAVATFDAPWVGYEPSPVRAAAVDGLVARVRAAAVDQALVLTSSHQSPLPMALLLRLAGVPWIAAVSRDYPGSLLDLRLAPPGDVHEVERALALARAAGFPLPAGDDGRLAVTGTEPSPPLPAAPYVVVHPGASVPARALGRERASALAGLLARAGWHVVVTGNAAERDVAEDVALGVPPGSATEVAGTTSLAAFASVLAGAAAVVTGNTAPVHLAAAVGTPVVSVFAPVVPLARWRPWRVAHAVFGDARIACAGCRARRCPIAGQPCLASATPAALADAVEALAPLGAGARPGHMHEVSR
jgi:ADP-heptose:LPS heptosyltransferase